jgi:hypothetical protein
MTPEQIEQGRALREAGQTYASISRQLSVPPTTVARNMKRYEPPPDPYDCGPSAVAELDPGDVAAEIQLMRSILLKAKSEGASAIVLAQLAKCINDLSKSWVASSVRAGKMLHVEKVRAVLAAIGGEIALAFLDVCPDAAERIDRVVASLLANARNDRPQTHELIGRER